MHLTGLSNCIRHVPLTCPVDVSRVLTCHAQVIDCFLGLEGTSAVHLGNIQSREECFTDAMRTVPCLNTRTLPNHHPCLWL